MTQGQSALAESVHTDQEPWTNHKDKSLSTALLCPQWDILITTVDEGRGAAHISHPSIQTHTHTQPVVFIYTLPSSYGADSGPLCHGARHLLRRYLYTKAHMPYSTVGKFTERKIDKWTSQSHWGEFVTIQRFFCILIFAFAKII